MENLIPYDYLVRHDQEKMKQENDIPLNNPPMWDFEKRAVEHLNEFFAELFQTSKKPKDDKIPNRPYDCLPRHWGILHASAAIFLELAQLDGVVSRCSFAHIKDLLAIAFKNSTPEKITATMNEVVTYLGALSPKQVHDLCYCALLLMREVLSGYEVQSFYDALVAFPAVISNSSLQKEKVVGFARAYFLDWLDDEIEFEKWTMEPFSYNEAPHWTPLHDLAIVTTYIGTISRGLENYTLTKTMDTLIQYLDKARELDYSLDFDIPEDDIKFLHEVAEALYIGSGNTIDMERVIRSNLNLFHAEEADLIKPEFTDWMIDRCFTLATSYGAYNPEVKLAITKLAKSWRHDAVCDEFIKCLDYTAAKGRECFVPLELEENEE